MTEACPLITPSGNPAGQGSPLSGGRCPAGRAVFEVPPVTPGELSLAELTAYIRHHLPRSEERER